MLYRGLDFLGPERSTNQTNVYQTMFGIEPRLPSKDSTYEVYVSTGRTTSLGAGYAQTCTTGLPVFGGSWPSAARHLRLEQQSR